MKTKHHPMSAEARESLIGQIRGLTAKAEKAEARVAELEKELDTAQNAAINMARALGYVRGYRSLMIDHPEIARAIERGLETSPSANEGCPCVDVSCPDKTEEQRTKMLADRTSDPLVPGCKVRITHPESSRLGRVFEVDSVKGDAVCIRGPNGKAVYYRDQVEVVPHTSKEERMCKMAHDVPCECTTNTPGHWCAHSIARHQQEQRTNEARTISHEQSKHRYCVHWRTLDIFCAECSAMNAEAQRPDYALPVTMPLEAHQKLVGERDESIALRIHLWACKRCSFCPEHIGQIKPLQPRPETTLPRTPKHLHFETWQEHLDARVDAQREGWIQWGRPGGVDTMASFYDRGDGEYLLLTWGDVPTGSEGT